MINTLLSQIAGLFEKDFLFASLLPALLVFAWAATVVLATFGVDFTFGAYEALSAAQQAGLAALFALALIVTAYLLNALRGPLIRTWSGESRLFNVFFFAAVALAERSHRSRFLRLRAAGEGGSIWLEIAEEFRETVAVTWSATRPAPGWIREHWYLWQARALHRILGPADVRHRLESLAEAFARYSGEKLRGVYEHVKRELMDRASEDALASRRRAVELDRSFGTLATVRATTLGNVIEAYNHYPYSRYCMEAEIFWPRLIKVIPSEFMARVREPKILLDFAITMASLSVVLAFSSLVVGPWIWFDLPIWLGAAVVQLLSAAFFYFLSVDAAVQYGDMVRACFDLFRLDLLNQLSLPRAANLKEEKARWEKVSQLLVYGQETDLQIAEVVSK